MNRGTVDHYESCPRGENHKNASLTDDAVRLARRLNDRKRRMVDRLNEKYSAEALAKRFRVSTSTMEKVLSFERWRHVR